MTAPGDFSSGDVLTAADMNGVSGGLVTRYATSGDVTFGTSASQLLSVTFTTTVDRSLLIMAVVPLIDNTSAAMQIGVWITDDNTVPLSGAYQATYNNVPSSGSSFDTNVVTSRTFSAGTYTLYTMAFTTTGTARMNNASGYRRAEMIVFDMGAG